MKTRYNYPHAPEIGVSNISRKIRASSLLILSIHHTTKDFVPLAYHFSVFYYKEGYRTFDIRELWKLMGIKQDRWPELNTTDRSRLTSVTERIKQFIDNGGDFLLFMEQHSLA